MDLSNALRMWSWLSIWRMDMSERCTLGKYLIMSSCICRYRSASQREAVAWTTLRSAACGQDACSAQLSIQSDMRQRPLRSEEADAHQVIQLCCKLSACGPASSLRGRHSLKVLSVKAGRPPSACALHSHAQYPSSCEIQGCNLRPQQLPLPSDLQGLPTSLEQRVRSAL